jgi:hypothetical protein
MKRVTRYLLRLAAVALVVFLVTQSHYAGPSPVPGGLPETAWPSLGEELAVLAGAVALVVVSMVDSLRS